MYVLNHFPRSPQQRNNHHHHYVCEKHRDAHCESERVGAATAIMASSGAVVSNSKRRTSAQDISDSDLLLYVEQKPMNITDDHNAITTTTSTTATITTDNNSSVNVNVNATATATATTTANYLCRFCLADQSLITDSTLTASESKHHMLSGNLSVVNIDSENYMLRGIGITSGSAAESPRGRSYSFTNGANKTPTATGNTNTSNYHATSKKVAGDDRTVDMDMFCLRETASSLPSGATVVTDVLSLSPVGGAGAGPIVAGSVAAVAAGSITASTSCARTLSFHSLLCTCYMSCCCMCGSLCSPDCHACFHSLCVRYAANYFCQRNQEVLPPATLNHEKVRVVHPFACC